MSFKIDAREVKALVGYVEGFEDAIARAEYRAVNKVAEKTLTRSRREITSRVALTQSYVRERMTLSPAAPKYPIAVISGRTRPTRLATFGAKQLKRPAKKAKGDPLRAIPAGFAQAGVSVMVTPGARKSMPGSFLIPLRNNNGMGVFWRYRDEIEHLYGPSVDQVFSNVITDIKDDVQADLEKTLAAQIDYEIKGLK